MHLPQNLKRFLAHHASANQHVTLAYIPQREYMTFWGQGKRKKKTSAGISIFSSAYSPKLSTPVIKQHGWTWPQNKYSCKQLPALLYWLILLLQLERLGLILSSIVAALQANLTIYIFSQCISATNQAPYEQLCIAGAHLGVPALGFCLCKKAETMLL